MSDFYLTREGSSSPGVPQLFLDFSENIRTRIADRSMRALVSKEKTPVPDIVYHREASTIEGNHFSLKISSGGRSYLLKGKYSKKEIKSWSQVDSVSNTTIDIIQLEIRAFCSDGYNTEVNSGDKVKKFQKYAEDTLSQHCLTAEHEGILH